MKLLFASMEKKIEFRGPCLKPWNSILQCLQIPVIFIMRTSGRVIQRKRYYLIPKRIVSCVFHDFPFPPTIFLLLPHPLIFFFSTQHTLNRPVTAHNSTLFSSSLYGAMLPSSCWYPCCAPYFVFIRHWLCKQQH